MSTYFKKGKGWRYDFTLKGERCTKSGFKTMAEARQAEAKRREELRNPPPAVETLTDMAFLELVNRLHSIGETEREAMAVYEQVCQDNPLAEPSAKNSHKSLTP